MPEWAFRITRNSEDLLQSLDGLTEWPDRITSAQRNWIGKSVGAEADFKVVGDRAIRVFTTRIDTVYGATVLVLAPDHPMVESVTTPAHKVEVESFAARMAALGKIERTAEGSPKEGVFTGAHAINP